MRILFCTPDPTEGGVSTSSERLIQSLEGRGHEVTHLHPEAHRFPDEPDRGRRWRIARSSLPVWTDHVLEAIDARSIEVVVGFYGWGPAQAAVAAGSLRGVPTVVALRGNDLDRDFLDPSRHGLVRWAIERADAVCTVSEEMACKVKRWCGREAIAVGNGVDTNRFRPVSGESFRAEHGLQGPVYGMFGELKPKRGVETLSQVAALGWTPLIVGKIRPSVSHLIPPEAVVVDWMEPDSLPEAYAACDVVGQPSLHDGLPNVVLEAMACARVVVARPVAGMLDVIRDGENGLFATSDNLAEVLERARNCDLGPAAREGVPTLEAEATAWERVLETIPSLRGRN